jgi:hypothetical protein
MNAYDLGREQALVSMGITKEAWAGAIGRTAAKWAPGVKQFGKNVAKNFKEITVGSPFKAIDQIQAGTALRKGGLIREGFNPGKGVMGKVFGGLMYGLPAYEGYQIMKSDRPDKAEQMGKLLGGTAAGLGTWRAFGMLGSMAATPLGSALGGAVGKGVSSLTGKGQQSQQQQQGMLPPPPQRPYYTPYGIMAAGAGQQMLRGSQWGGQR